MDEKYENCLYDEGEWVLLPDGCKGKFFGETEEGYEIERDFQYLVLYDKLDIDLLNVGIPYKGRLSPSELYDGVRRDG